MSAAPDLPAVGSAVDVQSAMWDGRFHRSFEGLFLGTDRWGSWVGVNEGTWLRTHRGGFASAGGVRLFPPGRWWSAWFSPGRVYVDVTTPPVWRGASVSLIDLDLDVEAFDGGPPVLRDEDEFDDHRVSMAYPDTVVTAARAAAAELVTLLRTRAEPFGDAATAWLP